jgi:hypothetical protein
LVTPLKVIYSSIQVSNVLVFTVRCKLINFVSQIFPLFIPEMPASFTSYIVKIIPIYFAWILCSTMLQAGRSQVRVPDEVDLFNLPNPSSRTMTLQSTEPLTEIGTRNLPGGKKRPACRADNLATICESNV